jgi:hypothetical protein
MKNLNAVKDISTQAILTFTKSYSSAVAVSQGLINTEPLIIPTALPKVTTMAKQFDLINDHLASTPDDWLTSLPKKLITPEYLTRRKLANLRATYIFSLETHLESVTQRGNINFDDSVMMHLIRAHSICRPEENFYSYGVVEYANIQNIDPKTAYQEIGLMIESCGLIKIRSFAWMQTCINKINAVTNTNDFGPVWKECWEVVKRSAYT